MRVVEGGTVEKKKSDMKTAVEKKIKCLCEHAGEFLGAQGSGAANYDSSGMSPELSAKRKLKKRGCEWPQCKSK